MAADYLDGLGGEGQEVWQEDSIRNSQLSERNEMKECELIRLSDGKWSVRHNRVEKAILPALAEIVFDDEGEED